MAYPTCTPRLTCLPHHPGPFLQADCACSLCSGAHAHAVLAAEMRRSTFCPVVAGDTASSARLTEVVLAGCIPVFIGEPWHSMPLAGDVDYPSFALFLEIADTRRWILEGSQVWGNSRRAVDRMGPDLPLELLAITLPSLRDVATFLRCAG